MTMMFSAVQKPAPTTVTLTRKPKGFVLGCDKPVDPWHDHWVIYQYASLVDANGDTNVVVRRSPFYHNPMHILDDLTVGAGYWFRVAEVDKYGNESIKAGQVNGVYKLTQDTDIETGAISTTKTKQRSKSYAGTTPVADTDFVTVAVDNVGGNSVRISWEWIVTARYSVSAAADASQVTLIATLWKKHGAGAKQRLHAVHARVARHAGNKRNLKDSSVHKGNKVFHDPKPKRGDTTTYGVDVSYKASGVGVHKSAVRKCELNITYNKR